MWQKPWGYKEGFVISGGLFLVGTLWQIVRGKCTLGWLAYPVNLYAGVLYIVLLIGCYVGLRNRSYAVRWMSSYPAAVASMVSVVGLTVVMGLIRQSTVHVPLIGIERWLGFSQMLSACSFLLLFFWFVTVLGLVIVRRIYSFAWRDIPFLFNHLGLFLALVGAVLGSADMQRLEMTTYSGKAEWRALNRQKEWIELPLAIELHEFIIDEYPPKLVLVDNRTGEVLPTEKPENLLIEEQVRQGQLMDWQIDIIQCLPMSASVATADTLRFVDFYSRGATLALYLKATYIPTGKQREGWVSCGSFLFPYKALQLDSLVSLIMPEREPKRFASEITVYTQSGKEVKATVEVNQPLEIDGWKIYQLSYDKSEGKWSDTSVFELVRDPWLPVVYIGIWMLIGGAICLFIMPHRKKEKV